MPLPLGKLPPRLDSRTLQLTDYLRSPHARPSEQGTALLVKRALPPAPRSVDWTAKIRSWPMFSNDTLGDCTAAAAAHMIQCWTANASHAFTPTNVQVIAAYSATGHYVPGNPSTDSGAVELDVLNFWRQQGIAGHKIDAYVAFNPQNFEHARQAINIFGGIYIGLALPLSAQNQDVWDVPSFFSRIAAFFRTRASRTGGSAKRPSRPAKLNILERGLPTVAGALMPLGHESEAFDADIDSISMPRRESSSARARRSCWSSSLQPLASSPQYDFTPGSWGGHAVPVLAYDSDTLTCITWGAKKRMTWEFFARYCDESYAPLSPDWLNARGKTPEGLDLDALQTDLTLVSEDKNSALSQQGTDLMEWTHPGICGKR